MEVAKVLQYANGQAVKLPEKYKFTCNEVAVQKLGSSLILIPKDKIDDSLLYSEAGRINDNKYISDSTIIQTRKGIENT